MESLEDYELRLGDELITDDDRILNDCDFKEPIYDFQMHLYLEDDRKVYYQVPKLKTKEEKVHDINSWYWSVDGDMMRFNTSFKLFNIQQDNYIGSDLSETSKLSTVLLDIDSKVEANQHVMFGMTDTQNLTAQQMVLYESMGSSVDFLMSSI